jgi:hypothetical protein
MEGHGKYTKLDEYSLEGEWKDDFIEGKGTEKLGDQWKYEGNFKRGKRNGPGIIEWFAIGSKYDGNWVDGKIDGHGTFEWSEKRTYTGDFKDNNMHGKGIYTWGDGRTYDGWYVNNKKEG